MTTPGETGLPRALERLLAEAAADEALREELLADRLGAAERRGHALSPAERAALEAVPDAQLRTLIEGLARQVVAPPATPPGLDAELMNMPITGIRPDGPVFAPQGIRPERPEPVRGIQPSPVKGIRPGRVVLAAAAVTTVGAAVGGVVCLSAGVRPDVPEVVEPVHKQGQQQEAVAPALEPSSDAGPEGGAEPDEQ